MRISLISLLLTIVSFHLMAADYFLFEENGKVGLKNESGQVVLPASFQALGWSDGSFSVAGDVTGYRVGQEWGLINLKKEFITKAEYISLTHAGGNYFIARRNTNSIFRKTGCINSKGEVVIPFLYDGITIQGLRAIVFRIEKSKYRFGLLNLQNTMLIPLQYNHIEALGSLRFAVENDENKTALYNESGKPITNFFIDSISSFEKSLAIIYENGKQGIIDRDGNIKIEPSYSRIERLEIDRVKAYPFGEWYVIDDKNSILQTVVADDLTPTPSGYIFKRGDKTGAMNSSFKEIIPACYDRLQYLNEQHWLAYQEKKCGIINGFGKIIIPIKYKNIIWSPKHILASTYQGWSLLDSTGKSLSYKNYDSLYAVEERLFVANHRGFWGMLDDKGNEIIHCVYDSLGEKRNELITVKFKNLYGIIDGNENWKAAPQSYPIKLINDSLYAVRQPANTFIKKLNGEILYFTGNTLTMHNDHLKEVLPDGQEKIIDFRGIITNRYKLPELSNIEKVFPLSGGFRGIRKDGKFGFIDEKGRLRVANRYDSIQNFSEELAAVKLIGKWGFIDGSDKIIINPNYDSVSGFQNGVCIAWRNGKAGLINKLAKSILRFEYDGIRLQPDGTFLLKADGLLGLADRDGKILIEPRFDKLVKNGKEQAVVARNGKYGVITTSGLSVIPIMYDYLVFDKDSSRYLAQKKGEQKEFQITK